MNAPAIQFDPDSARFGASRTQKRVEDDRLLKGQGLFSDDRVFPEQAWLSVLRSPHAHAKVVSIDISAAAAAPGVLAVYTIDHLKADGLQRMAFPPLFKRGDGSPMAAPPRHALAEML